MSRGNGAVALFDAWVLSGAGGVVVLVLKMRLLDLQRLILLGSIVLEGLGHRLFLPIRLQQNLLLPASWICQEVDCFLPPQN